MHQPRKENVYFTLDEQHSISTVILVNGRVTVQKDFSQSQLPSHWIDALHEMKETWERSVVDATNIPLPQPESQFMGTTETCFAPSDQVPQPRTPCLAGLENAIVPLQTVEGSADIDMIFPFTAPSQFADVDLLGHINVSLGSPCHTTPAPSGPSLNIAVDLPCLPVAASTTTGSEPRRFKRVQKLCKMLETLKNHPVLSLEDHNRQVEGLYKGFHLTRCSQAMSIVQFAAVLGRYGSVSAAVGTIYGLLCWNIFAMEEDRLIYTKSVPAKIAAKQMNQKMTDVLRHRGKAKDWASDGRRAARMIFRALKDALPQDQSFALILLGEVCSLDCLLKIAHFPVLREIFQEQFAAIIALRSAEWSFCHEGGYKVFDYKLFLGLP